MRTKGFLANALKEYHGAYGLIMYFGVIAIVASHSISSQTRA
jgi:hypothetical protein